MACLLGACTTDLTGANAPTPHADTTAATGQPAANEAAANPSDVPIPLVKPEHPPPKKRKKRSTGKGKGAKTGSTALLVPLPDRNPVIDPRKLIGLDEAGIREMLGDPSLVEEKSPSRVWNYSIEGCKLDIFLYLDLSTMQFRALTYKVETKIPTKNSDVIGACVGRIQSINREKRERS